MNENYAVVAGILKLAWIMPNHTEQSLLKHLLNQRFKYDRSATASTVQDMVTCLYMEMKVHPQHISHWWWWVVGESMLPLQTQNMKSKWCWLSMILFLGPIRLLLQLQELTRCGSSPGTMTCLEWLNIALQVRRQTLDDCVNGTHKVQQDAAAASQHLNDAQ